MASCKLLLAIGLAVLLCALCACRRASKEDLPRLIQELSNKDAHVRNQAALSIASLGKDGEKAVKPLIRVLYQDANRGVKSAAAYALDSIGTEEAVQAVKRYRKEHPPGSD